MLYFTVRDYHRFGAEYLENKGYNVEVWRVNDGISPNVKLNVSAGIYHGKNMRDLSVWEFERYVKKNREAFFVLYDYKSVIYLRALARYHCNYFVIQGIGKVLLNGTDIPRVKDIKKKRSNYMIEQLKKKYRELSSYVAEWYFRNYLPQYVFLGVDVNDSWLTYLPIDRKIYIHSYDYDRYLETKENKAIGEYIVYIDGGIGNLTIDQVFAPYNDPWYGKGDKLWNKIENIFDNLEEYFHAPIIIAGHPHTKYVGNTLCNRKIIYNRTPELVAKSKFVIMQWSTTISLALLFEKKVLALIDNDFKKITLWNEFYAANYKYFGITPCNMDVPEMAQAPWKYVHEIERNIAQRYINTYIKKPNTPDKLFIQVIEEKIKEMSVSSKA